MSLDIWPPIPPSELRSREAEAQERELEWIAGETVRVCEYIKHGLEDCYALLAPIDPGSTLVMSTPRNEKVKGTITRVGTRIVKGTLHLQLNTIPVQTLTLSQRHAVHIHALDDIHARLTQAIDLLTLTLSDSSSSPNPESLSSTLRVLSDSLSESHLLLKGPPPPSEEGRQPPNMGWQTASIPPDMFSPPLPAHLSVHVALQDSSIVLALRALEPVDAPVHFGMKLGLAIGTVRRIEHDEMDVVYRYDPAGCASADSKRTGARHGPEASAQARGQQQQQQETRLQKQQMMDVYVREKVRVESGDPSLISLSSKLIYLNNVLGLARRNLEAALGNELED